MTWRRLRSTLAFSLFATSALLPACGADETDRLDDAGSESDAGSVAADTHSSVDSGSDDVLDGIDGGASDSGRATDTYVDPEICRAESTPLRRLSHFEYRNTIQALFPDTEIPTVNLPADTQPHEFDNDAEGTIASGALIESYLEAGRVIAAAVGDELPMLSGCEPADDSPEELSRCGEAFVAGFGSRVFRRPLSDAEVAEYSALMTAEIDGASYQDRLRLTLQVLLASPEFLYRIETPVDAIEAGSTTDLDAYSLASRLSYFLWASMPDEELMAAASDGSLLDPDVYESQVRRLADDERARASFRHFHEQWLDVGRIEHTTKTTEDGLDEELRVSMQEQSTRFVDTVLFDEYGGLTELLTSERVFYDAQLAPLYGLEPPTDGWAETSVGHRPGILSQPFFLASHGHPDKPSPVLRGAFVLDRVMCESLGAPPPNAEAEGNAVAESLEGPLTNRQFYDLITSEATCASCHDLINPVGAVFESYDTMGRFQTVEPNGLEIDTRANLRGTEFANVTEFMAHLATDELVEACMVQKWVRYAYAGGPLERSDCFIAELRTQLHEQGGSIRDLQVAIALHPFFRMYVAPEDL